MKHRRGKSEKARAEEYADRLEAVIQSAARDALILHKRMGNPIADWRDGRVVWIQPEDIEIPPDPLQPETGAKRKRRL